VFDVAGPAGKHFKFSNDGKGFKDFFKSFSAGDLVVMEAVGYYHYRLAVPLCGDHACYQGIWYQCEGKKQDQ